MSIALTPDQERRGRELARIGKRLLFLESKLARTPECGHPPIQQEIAMLKRTHQPLLTRAGAQLAR